MTDSASLNLAYKQYSDAGPPLLVLHGLFGSQSNWGWHNKQFAETHAVYGLDLRNHGDSPHSAALDYPLMAADVKSFIEQKQLTGCVILGHSMGGKVAMQLALNSPELVSRLLVVDIAPVAYASKADGHLRVIAGMRALDLTNLDSRREAETQLAGYIEDSSTRQFVLTNLTRSDDGGYQWRLNLDAIEANYDKLREKPEMGSPYTGPTLFVKGALSNYIQAEHETEILEQFPAAEVKIIMGAGHWVHAEKPQALQKVVADFLAR
ncbi:MAG: alpha/beta fold hydrolase [Pseudomonadales bacterium]|nr:alpha/beta fold hydrolase [Pseudomonadales bacterium]